MEDKDERKIIKNLHNLIENTICSTIFMEQFSSRSILSAEELEVLKTEGNNRGRFAQAAKFYSILTTKFNSFHVLVEALTFTKQSEALSYLYERNISAEKQKSIKYKRPPAHIQEFISDDLKLLVLISKDCEISGDWILQTVPNTNSVTIDEFLKYKNIEPSTTSLERISVITCGLNLERTLYYVTTSSEKIILITSKLVDIAFIKQSSFASKLNINKIKVTEDHIEWEDLSDEFQSQILTTLEMDIHVSKVNLLSVLPNVDNETLLVLIRGEVPMLLKNTIPKALSYYVERKLITRNRISNKIFDNPGDDIFLFTDIESEVLAQKAKVGHVANSGHLLSDNYEDDDNFVILQAEEHFEQICVKFTERTVHVLKNNQSNFIWIKSRGNLSKLHLTLERNQLVLPEDRFLEETFKTTLRTPICISDSPGMGKSVLLAQIARQLQVHSKCIVAFVVINELVQYAKVQMGTGEVNESIMRALLVYLRNNSLGDIYLQNHKDSVKEILFDGFDEIDADDVDLGYKCLKVIQSIFTEARIWVTARPHMLLELENALEVLGYSISAFQEQDQIKFLNLYWSHESTKTGNVNSKKLDFFAKEWLSALKSNMREEDQDIAGIPLQCLLIAEVYEKDAISFISSNSTDLENYSTSLLKIHSLVDLYQHFVTKKFENFHIRYEKESVPSSHLSSAHIRFSIDHLFPSFQHTFFSNLEHSLSRQEIFDVGFLESQNILSSSRFIHRTFAEYFVALFVVDTLEKGCTEVMFDFVVKNILDTREAEFDHIPSISATTRQFKSTVICYFVNNMLEYIASGLLSFSNQLSAAHPTILQRLTEASAYSNQVHIFRKLCFQASILPPVKRNIFRTKLIFCTVSRSGRSFNETVLHHFKSLQNIPLHELQFCDLTLLHIAVARGSFLMVELLLKEEKFEKLFTDRYSPLHFLFVSWIKTCDSETHSSLNEKKQILRLLASHGLFDGCINLSRNIDLIHQSLAEELTAMYTSNIAKQHEGYFVEALGEIMESSPDKCQIFLKILFNERNTFISDSTKIITDLPVVNFYLDANVYEQALRELEHLPSPECNSNLSESHLLISLKSRSYLHAFNLKLKMLSYQRDNSPLYYYRDDVNNTNLCQILLNVERISHSKQNILEITKFVFENATRVHIFKSFEETFADLLDENTYKEMFDLAKTFHLTNPILSVLLKLLYITKNKELDKNLRLEIRDVNNETLFHFAAHSANKELLELYLPFCLDINTSNKRDETALHHLAVGDYFTFESWKYLVDNNANIFALDNHLQIPISYLSYQDTNTGLRAVLYTLNKLHLAKDSRIDNIIFVVISRLTLELVKSVCEWYQTFIIKPFDDIIVNISGKDAKLLDAAFLNYDGNILEYVVNILKCKSYLCIPPKTSIHNCLSEQQLSEEQMVAYIKRVAEYFPEFLDAQNEEGCVSLCNVYITLETVEALLESGANANITDYEGNTPLHTAVRRNDSPEIISALVKFGADINAENFSYETPFICSTKITDKRELPGLIQHLLKLGADPRKFYENGNTILHLLPPKVDQLVFQETIECCIYFGYNDVLELLNEDGKTPLDIAELYFKVDDKYIEIFKKETTTSMPWESLLLASKFTNVKEIQCILKSGANPNVTDENLNTPLHKVTQNVFSLECWKILLENGSDPLALNINDKTPICLLPYFEFSISTEAILFALEKVAISDKTKLGDILVVVVSTHAYETVQKAFQWYDEHQGRSELIGHVKLKGKVVSLLDAALICFDGDVVEFVMSKLGCSELLHPPPSTAIHGSIKSSKLFFEQKLKFIKIVGKLCPELVNNRNDNQLVPLSLDGIEYELVEPLVELGADINAHDGSGNTPLHYALKHSLHYLYTPKLVLTLIKYRAKINAQNNLGETPLFLSVEYIALFEEILCIKYLVDNGANVRQQYSSGNTIFHLLAAKLNKECFHTVIDYFLTNGFFDLFSLRNEQCLTPLDLAKLHFELLPKSIELLKRFNIPI